MVGMTTGGVDYAKDQYSAGQILIDPSERFLVNATQGSKYDPSLQDGPIARLEKPFSTPTSVLEQQGQVDQVIFVEGLVQFKGK